MATFDNDGHLIDEESAPDQSQLYEDSEAAPDLDSPDRNRRARVFDLSCSPVAEKFYYNDKRISMIMGPVGSGKSVATMMKIIRLAGQQEPNWEGVRKTRWAVVRNTYAQLEDTTIKTWHAWYPPPHWGKWKVSRTEYKMKWQMEDGTVVECEVMFRALDRPDQVDNLLSAEYTGAWFNEARHIDVDIFDMMDNRIGRYPDPNESRCSWLGIMLDTNPPDEDNWIYKLFEEKRPDNAIAFYQPSGLSPEAENLQNLPEGYYQNIIKTKDEYYVHVYVKGQYGYLRTGKPVYPEYNDHVHCSPSVTAIAGLPLYIGLDFGLTPACVICQMTFDGRLLVLDEVTSTRAGIKQFLSVVQPYIAQAYPDHDIEAWVVDPAGDQKGQNDLTSPIDTMMDAGVFAQKGQQDPVMRIEAVKNQLNRMVDGNPAIMLSPKARMLRKGFTGHYQYRRMQVSKEKYTEKPDKNEASHVHDALQYLCTFLFGGWGSATDKHRAPRVVGVSARGTR